MFSKRKSILSGPPTEDTIGSPTYSYKGPYKLPSHVADAAPALHKRNAELLPPAGSIVNVSVGVSADPQSFDTAPCHPSPADATTSTTLLSNAHFFSSQEDTQTGLEGVIAPMNPIAPEESEQRGYLSVKASKAFLGFRPWIDRYFVLQQRDATLRRYSTQYEAESPTRMPKIFKLGHVLRIVLEEPVRFRLVLASAGSVGRMPAKRAGKGKPRGVLPVSTGLDTDAASNAGLVFLEGALPRASADELGTNVMSLDLEALAVIDRPVFQIKLAAQDEEERQVRAGRC